MRGSVPAAHLCFPYNRRDLPFAYLRTAPPTQTNSHVQLVLSRDVAGLERRRDVVGEQLPPPQAVVDDGLRVDGI